MINFTLGFLYGFSGWNFSPKLATNGSISTASIFPFEYLIAVATSLPVPLPTINISLKS